MTLDLFGTSDLHGSVLQFDYVDMAATQGPALVQLAKTLKEARAKTANSMLFDNGDLIQGTAFADTLVANRQAGLNMHSFLGLCGYDAATLGNHDLDYGPDVLDDLIDTASCPYVCANIVEGDFKHPPQFIILPRTVTCHDGQNHELKIGVTGCLPQQSQYWSQLQMGRNFELSDPVSATRRAVANMKRAGADICIVLAHSGYIADPAPEEPANFARSISQLADVNAVFAGHIHRAFSQDQTADGDAATVMPGCNASHLGHISLTLVKTDDAWSVTSGTAEAIGSISFHTGDTDIFNTAQNTHRLTLARMNARLGQTRFAMSSFFAQVAPNSASQFVHNAQQAHLSSLLEGTEFQGLPLISAVALARVGGEEGSKNYSFLPAGPINLHNIHDIYRYENQFCAMILTGAQIYGWLEQSASCFHQITPHETDQPLLNPRVPAYDYDTFDGIDYEIDLTQPAAFDHLGNAVIAPEDRKRIKSITYKGQPISADQRFALATSGFRRNRAPNAPCIEAGMSNRDVLIQYLTQRQVVDPTPIQNWKFSPIKRASAVFKSSPLAVTASKLPTAVSYVGPSQKGFALYRIRFDA
ncbi:5'-nucleotidase C-terminal domain-containing protein [Algirhabdus cladophorae]|uniref:5'-nucleotidase C-terminal domain-containing protein n=1 Tax=Algirhabdus cladophorae TaxID=3377108 RepID=UPI003B848928